MDEKDGRRSRVPAGTFGDSTPPPTEEADGTEHAPASERKRFTSTLTGKGAFGDTDPPSDGDDTAPALRSGAAGGTASGRAPRQRTGNTLVGHPSMPPPVPSGSSAPVLAPPKWRGARPYLEGEEPQPQVSSIPTPPPSPLPAKPAGVAIGMLRSKVTTKVGQPVAQPPVAAQQPAIDDTIQRMLETQASVPMQVEESTDGDSIPEIPLDQLPIEELEDSLPRVPKAALTAVRAAEARAVAAASAAPSNDGASHDTAPALRGGFSSRASSGPSDLDGLPGFASSVAPAEVVSKPRKDDSHVSMGLLAVAVFALVFVGGWFATRGGYEPRRPAVSAAAPAPATAAPSGPSDLAPAPAAALTKPEPPAEAEPTTPGTAPATSDPAAKPPTVRARTASKSAPAAPASTASADDGSGTQPATAAPGVLTVKPRLDPASLPEIPGREEVIAALEPLRPAISECSRGTHGVAQLDITVSSSGAVSHAVVGGDFAGTAEGSCIARAARTAQFTPFKKPRFRVIYPFSL